MPVTLRGVGHSFPGGRRLFRDVTHTFAPGSVTGIVGPSGSGKSTLLGVVAGMIEPAEGLVERSGERCAWVFQNPHGVARRTALDHVALPVLARGRSRSAAEGEARELLERFRLTDRASVPFAALSGGEAQRLMLARAMAAAPALLLVDEPTAQLDRVTAQQVNAVLSRTSEAGAAVVVATHDAGTRASCDAVIDLGDHR